MILIGKKIKYIITSVINKIGIAKDNMNNAIIVIFVKILKIYQIYK